MPDLSAKKTNFISRSAEAGVAILANVEELRELRREATVLDYGASLTDADFVGANKHLSKADLVALFGTIDAIVALLEANNATHYRNLMRLVQ